jgi:high-affinity iron transporter
VTAAFFITLREGLEAALIVGIICAYLVKLDRRDALRGVWIGVAAAIVLSVAVGALVVATVGRLPLVVQETVEGLAAVFAVIVLTWMLFWMRRQGRAIKGELEHGVDLALARGSTTALAALAFMAVAREGLETVLFLYAIGSSSGPVVPTLLAAIAGLAVAVAIGWAIFAAGIRIDLRRFFTITGIVLIFVSAGLVAFAVHEFGEAGLITNSGAVIDLGDILPESSPLGAVLAGLFGYRSAPTPLEVIAYFAYLVPVLILFLRPARRVASGPAAAVTSALVIAMIAAGCASSASGSPAKSGIPGAIRVGASEYKFDPATLSVPSGSTTFELVNTGTTEHEFEILQGGTAVGKINAVTPGNTGSLTVTLSSGDYTYVCRLAAHDALGMKGTLGVSGG